MNTVQIIQDILNVIQSGFDHEPELLKSLGIDDALIIRLNTYINNNRTDFPTDKQLPLPAKIATTELFTFDQLSEDAQQKAVEKLWDINVNYEWWDSTYEDANTIGLTIEGFDIDRGAYCNGKFNIPMIDVAERIISNHGESCETYKDAKKFIDEYNKAVELHSDGIDKTIVTDENDVYFENYTSDMVDEFQKTILEDYRIILQNEYEYLTGKEAIVETIESNDYTFEIDGKMNNG